MWQGRPEQRGNDQYIIYLNDEDKLKLLIFLYDHSFLVVVFTIYWNPIACGNTSSLRVRSRKKKKIKKHPSKTERRLVRACNVKNIISDSGKTLRRSIFRTR